MQRVSCLSFNTGIFIFYLFRSSYQYLLFRRMRCTASWSRPPCPCRSFILQRFAPSVNLSLLLFLQLLSHYWFLPLLAIYSCIARHWKLISEASVSPGNQAPVLRIRNKTAASGWLGSSLLLRPPGPRDPKTALLLRPTPPRASARP